MIITDVNNLAQVLQEATGASVTGNVLLGSDNAAGGGDDDAFGADGPGYVTTLRWDRTATAMSMASTPRATCSMAQLSH